MSPRPSFLVAGAATLALLFTACGGDDGERPTASALSETFEESGVDEAAADCLGEAYADSDISDGGLRQIVDADLSEGADPSSLADADVSDGDAEAASEISDQVSECIMAGIDLPEDPTATTEAEG